MALPKLYDRVKETSTTTGTGDITLAGAVSGYRAFGDVLSNNDLAFYVIEHQSAAEWEVGYVAWLTGNTLDRTAATILASSNAGAAVNFSAGTKHVWLDAPANLLDRIMQPEEITGTTATMVPNRTYVANNASQVVLTLPDTAPVGSRIKVIGKGAGGWKIAQNASELIRYRGLATTTGTGGYIQSLNDEDVVELVCVVANTEWTVVALSDRVQTDDGTIWGTRCIIHKFTASGTWTKPQGMIHGRLFACGGGPGGGSGRRGAAGTNRSGGAAGSTGGILYCDLIAANLGATETVTIGAGGTGGAAVTANDTNGNAGNGGGDTFFGSISVIGGNGGAGGTTGSVFAGTARTNYFNFAASTGVTGGGAGVSGGSNGNGGILSVTGGGGGGGLDTANTERTGGSGGNVTDPRGQTLVAGGAFGAAGGGNGGAGNVAGSDAFTFGSGGGGGGSKNDGVNPGGNGGAGGAPGAGGGGGGASANGANSGAGGDGARGEVWVISYL